MKVLIKIYNIIKQYKSKIIELDPFVDIKD